MKRRLPIGIQDFVSIREEGFCYYEDFCKYDIETMRSEPLLYQSGYLTIKDYDEELNQFILDYPNEEVRASFSKALLEQYLQPSVEASQGLNSN